MPQGKPRAGARWAALAVLLSLAAFAIVPVPATAALPAMPEGWESAAAHVPPVHERRLALAPRGRGPKLSATFAFQRAELLPPYEEGANANERSLSAVRAVPSGQPMDDVMVARALRRMFAAGFDRIAVCYDRLLLSAPDAAGTINVLVDIGSHGRVDSAQIVYDGFALPQMGECVLGALRSLRAAADLGSRVIVELPLVFAPVRAPVTAVAAASDLKPALGPTVAQRHGAVEHGASGPAVLDVGDKVAVAQKLPVRAGRGVAQRRLDQGTDGADRVGVQVIQKTPSGRHVIGVFDSKQTIVHPHFDLACVRGGDPVYGTLDLTAVVAPAATRRWIIATVQRRNLAARIGFDPLQPHVVGMLEPDFLAGGEAEPAFGRVERDVVPLDPQLAAKWDSPAASFWIFRVVFGIEPFDSAFGVVVNDQLDRVEHRHRAQRGPIEIFTHAMFQEPNVGVAVGLGNADAFAKIADRGGGYAAPP